MADERERTPAEREAARLARARRRAERAAQPASGPEPREARGTTDAEREEQAGRAAVDDNGGRREAVLGADRGSGFDQGFDHEFETYHEREFETDLDPEFERDDGHQPEFESDDGHEPEFESDDGHESEFETGEHELEVPSGTRRISHLESLTTRGDRKQQPKRRPKRVRRDGQRPRHSWVVRIASILALVLAAALIWFLVELFQPLHGSPHGSVTVVVPQRSSSGKIGDLLADKGVISSSFFFELRATLAGERDDLRSGVYHLQQGMSYGAVLSALTKVPPAAKVTNVTITEGRTRHEVNALLRSQHVRGSYLAATRTSPLLNPKTYGARNAPQTLEGFLFPDTYQLVVPIKMSKLVADQLRAFKQHFAKVNFSGARRRHLSPYDVLIIASLIEGEAATERDRLLVSSVIYNRLADGMALQLDATTRFATGNYTRALTLAQLHSRSPYNTRTHVGLPPGPINSPGMAAIQAAAHPAHTRYLYFFTPPCGHKDEFASSYSQFLAQGSQHLNKRC